MVSLTHCISITIIQSNLLNSVSFWSLKICFTKFQSVALGRNGCPGSIGADLKLWFTMNKKENKFLPSCLPKEDGIFLDLLNNYPRVWELLKKITVAGTVILAMLSQRNKLFSHLHLV